MKILAVIPARGGSKGIPRKNVRFIGGKPLIAHVITTALQSKYDIEVVVTSDDEEVLMIAEKYGATALERPAELATDVVTLDPVIFHAVKTMEDAGNAFDIVITIQPTSPLLSVQTFDNAIDEFVEKGHDTVISGVNHPHLSWTFKDGEYVPNYTERLNRQYLPAHFQETGAFVITKREFVTEKGRFGKKISIFETPANESVDIDTPQDWWIVEKEMHKKTVLIRLDGYKKIGMGHVYRGLQMAYHLIDHIVIFVLSKKSDLGIAKIESSFYPMEVIEEDSEMIGLIEKYQADIVINDILNTSKEYIELLKSTGKRIINFEDLGEGAKLADAVINDLYEDDHTLSNGYWGSDYYIIKDEFRTEKPKKFSHKVQEILVCFGGTDPNNLTYKTVEALLEIIKDTDIHCTVILGLGYQNKEELEKLIPRDVENIELIQDVKMMSHYMKRADLALSSQGRTMLELASMGVPTVLLAQNERETTHEFGSLQNGFLNLGMGKIIESKTIENTIRWLMECPQIREGMYNQMVSKDLRSGMERVRKIIFKEI